MKRVLRHDIGRALAYLFVLELGLVPAILFWPSFRDNLGALKAMAPLPMLKDMVDKLGDGGAASYVLGQHFFKGCNTLGTAAAVLFAVGAVAGQVHRGTLEIWLARPVSRSRLLFERYLSGALGTIVPVFLATATIPYLLTHVDEQMDPGGLLAAATHQSLFLLAFFSVSFFLSTVGSNPMRIAFGLLIFSTLEFSLYLVKQATHYSIFRLVDLQAFIRVYNSEKIQIPYLVGCLAVIAGSWIASTIAFARRVP